MTNSSVVSINMTTVSKLRKGEIIRDKTLRGFGARRQGSRTSYFIYRRVNGKKVYITIGVHGEGWNPATARDRAEELAREMKTGFHPGEVRRKAREDALTVSEALDKFLEAHGPKIKPRTYVEYERLVRKYLKPAFGKRDVQEVDHGGVATAHSKWRRFPRTANQALAVMSKFMSWCEDQKLRPRMSNPCVGVKRYCETKRDRYLTSEELASIGKALDALEAEDYFVRSAVGVLRFLLLTGARKEEALGLKWAWYDQDRKTFSLPDSKTGKKRLAINDEVVDLLKTLPRSRASEFVFVGRGGNGRLWKIDAIWKKVCSRAGVTGVRIHDLRHSYASFAVDLGVPLPAISRALGHADLATTQRYVHVRDGVLAESVNRTGAFISGLMKRGASADSDGASEGRTGEAET